MVKEKQNRRPDPVFPLQRMAGLVQEESQQQSDGGEHGGYASIISDFVDNRSGGVWPYKDEKTDQAMIELGIKYYNAGCHNK